VRLETRRERVILSVRRRGEIEGRGARDIEREKWGESIGERGKRI
jgi:hypothetical protein